MKKRNKVGKEQKKLFENQHKEKKKEIIKKIYITNHNKSRRRKQNIYRSWKQKQNKL